MPAPYTDPAHTTFLASSSNFHPYVTPNDNRSVHTEQFHAPHPHQFHPSDISNVNYGRPLNHPATTQPYRHVVTQHQHLPPPAAPVPKFRPPLGPPATPEVIPDSEDEASVVEVDGAAPTSQVRCTLLFLKLTYTHAH